MDISEIKKTILKYAKEEQKLRFSDDICWTKLKEIDLRNQAFLKDVIKEHSGIIFNPQSMGAEFVRNCWLIVQHSDNDIRFQEKCLELMKSNNCPAVHIAYLTDRVMVGRAQARYAGKNICRAFDKQEYYTQWCLDNDTKQYHVPPNLDLKKLAAKRQTIGMPFSKEVFPNGVWELIQGQNRKPGRSG